MSKALIVYASAGAGHQKASEAVYYYLKAHCLDLDLKVIDLLDYTPKVFKLLYSRGYSLLVSKFPRVWHCFYRISFFFAEMPFLFWLDYLTCAKFIRLIESEKPDIVLSTHFLASSVITVFKNKNPHTTLKLISVVTDYILHPFWLGEGVDVFIVSCDSVKDELIEKNIPAYKIKPLGIPAKEKFYQPTQRRQIAERLKLNPDEFTALIITGAFGFGPIEQIARALSGSVQLLVVCGNNAKLYQRLQRLKLPLVKAYPLIDYVDDLMSVADVVLTKAGGLTITESLAKGLPMIFFSNIPGLETANERVLCGSGAGIRTKTISEIKETVLSFKHNPEVYQNTVNKIKQFRKQTTLQDIASTVTDLIKCQA